MTEKSIFRERITRTLKNKIYKANDSCVEKCMYINDLVGIVDRYNKT